MLLELGIGCLFAIGLVMIFYPLFEDSEVFQWNDGEMMGGYTFLAVILMLIGCALVWVSSTLFLIYVCKIPFC